MKKVLVLKSSILAENSQTNQLSDYFVSKLAHAEVTQRDIAQQPLPHFDSIAANALRGQPTTQQELALLSLSDQLVNELKDTDIVVINAPMYNFNIPTQLKSYFDFIARPRVTFQYGSNGPEGLIKGKKAIVLVAFGGLHQNRTTDLVTAYVKTMLAFVGITDVQFIYAEGIGSGAPAIEKAQTLAKQQIDQVLSSL
ncbi:MAG: NAD(P)H-dependent oxidoreductase [Pasteurella oralis]|uniref:NAD(P)H-dependent oxidoreductase n=1 Tax=Pasteurella oralis TaxID=1071947 RepID=UPI002701C8F2|nr:NAD(P)H-dependent oxidoreductase [Pasteurella oralis]